MASDLTKFGLREMLHCGTELRRLTRGARTMEAAAQRVCGFFHEELRAPDESRACVLVRCYKTHPFGALDASLQRFARGLLGADDQPTPTMRCLTLIATVGDEPAWNSRHRSRGHRAIPLPSPEIVEKAPMIAQLIRQFGLDIADVVRPSPDVVRELGGKTYGVFHVEHAAGSPYIPAQDDFVAPFGVRSVLGFGGSLRAGDLFAVVLFARVPIAASVADRFRTLALEVKSAFFLFTERETFEPAAPPGPEAAETSVHA